MELIHHGLICSTQCLCFLNFRFVLCDTNYSRVFWRPRTIFLAVIGPPSEKNQKTPVTQISSRTYLGFQERASDKHVDYVPCVLDPVTSSMQLAFSVTGVTRCSICPLLLSLVSWAAWHYVVLPYTYVLIVKNHSSICVSFGIGIIFTVESTSGTFLHTWTLEHRAIVAFMNRPSSFIWLLTVVQCTYGSDDAIFRMFSLYSLRMKQALQAFIYPSK